MSATVLPIAGDRPRNSIAWETLPLWLTKADVAAIYGLSSRAVERCVRLRKKLPPPSLTHPMRWSRDVLRRHWDGESVARMSRRQSA